MSAGTIAGRYTLLREIGRGGMGSVWLGEDELLGREVALKRIGLLPGADETDLARAEREARLAAQLNHPHVVAIYTIVHDEATRQRWLVMEHVPGTTLAELVRQTGALEPDEAAPLLRQLAEALVAAHEAGIVHRDVKPSNVLIDLDQQVKLTDFGIARTEADPSLTQTGMLTGSPAYLAPEVVEGRRGDEAVDVWSFGATVFHVLAGRPPYDIGENVIGGLYRIVNDEPPRLADAGWMGPLLDATMVKDPSRRWTMRQVLEFLESPGGAAGPMAEATASPTALLAPVLPTTHEAHPDGPGGRRRSGLVLAGVALALVVLVGLVVAALEGREETTAGGPGASAATSESSDDPASPGSASTGSSPAEPSESSSGERTPTVAGMKQFVRDYVTAVSTDPATSWQMLTPRFQRESGGFEAYRQFWSGVGAPTLLAVAADPESLSVSYRVAFENFGTGRRPTVLDLVYDGERYLVERERTEGFRSDG